ncbi:hypothetical protein JCM8547_002325 [Rhodosporidiobolus lusitaniae]
MVSSGAGNGWDTSRRSSHDSQVGFTSSSSAARRPSYQHDPLTGQEPPDFDPSRPSTSTSRRPSFEQTFTSSSRSRSSSVLADTLANGQAGVRKMGSREWGNYRPHTPENWHRELRMGEEARGSPARRRSEDAGVVSGAQAVRKGSATSLRRELQEGALPSTPARRGRLEEEEEEELTPKAVAGGRGEQPARSRQPSNGSVASVSKPLHTPPTLLPSGTRTHPDDYSPSRSNSRPSVVDQSLPSTTSSSAQPTTIPSSPESSYSHSSLSSEPGDDWATSHLPSGSSPPRSPLLAEVTRQARISSLASAVVGARESRPISEFDFAAAYAHSDGSGSLPNSPAVGGGDKGFAPMEGIEEKQVAEEDHPLPSLPREMEDKSLPSTPSAFSDPQRPFFAAPPTQSQPAAAVPRPVLALHSALPSSPSVTSASSPLSAVSTVAPLPPPTQSSLLLSPTGTDHPPRPSSSLSVASFASSDAGASSEGGQRSPSRSSSRLNKPQPPRPPRRVASNLSLVSSRSAQDLRSAAAEGAGSSASTAPLAPSSTASTTPPVEPPAASLLPSSSTSSLSLTTTPSPPPSSTLTRPRGATVGSLPSSSGTPGSLRRRDRGPPPDIPEKSRRRTSALISASGSGKRLSMLGGVAPSASMGELSGGGKEGREGDGKEEEGTPASLGEQFSTPISMSGFSTNTDSHSQQQHDLTRDSFYDSRNSLYDSYATSTYQNSPVASPSVPSSSHFREATTIEDPPVTVAPPSPVPPAATAARQDNGHLRTGSNVSERDDFHDASSGPRSASALSHLSSSSVLQAATVSRSRSITPGGGLSVDAELARAASPAGSAVSAVSAGGGASGRDTPNRGDAKARAAAFIADLKRAKQQAAASAGNSPVVEQQQQQPAKKVEDDEEEGETLHISTPKSPLSPSVVISPSIDFSTASSPMLPSLPSSPNAPDSPIPPLRVNRSGSTWTTTSTKPATSPPLPPFPPLQATKRPSQSSVISTSSISRPYPQHQHSFPSSLSPTVTSLPTIPSSAPLLRRRPLPTAIQASKELKSARTPRERARIYAEKINELGRERSRLEEWIGSVRDTRTGVRRSSVPSSPMASSKLSRAARQDSSTATFAPRADSYRAKEITSHSFGPRDLVPSSAPYPGVIGLAASKYSLGSQGSSSSGGGKFFGLGRGSLGRRTSKRDHPTPHHTSSSLSSASSTIGKGSISGPITLTSAPSTVSSATSRSLLSGPRMPNPTPPSRHRASFDSRGSSPSGSPVPERDRTARSSFSYGTTSSAATARAGLAGLVEAGYEVGGAGGGGASNEEEEKVDRLADILPTAERGDLLGALRQAGGDDVLAISCYLSGEAMKR